MHHFERRFLDWPVLVPFKQGRVIEHVDPCGFKQLQIRVLVQKKRIVPNLGTESVDIDQGVRVIPRGRLNCTELLSAQKLAFRIALNETDIGPGDVPARFAETRRNGVSSERFNAEKIQAEQDFRRSI
jgi:hypothetical protein